MSTPLVLTFDVGTQSLRAILVKPDGSFADMYQIKYKEPYFSKAPGLAEQKPDFYYNCLCEAAKALCGRNTDKTGDIIAVALTAIRDTVLCLDKNNKPLRDIIVWLDKRKADFDNPFPLVKRLAFRAVGMGETTKIIYRAAYCNWIKQHEPEIWEKTDKYVMLPTYLCFKLTGRLIASKADMIGHIPFDYKKRSWQGEGDLTRCIFDIPAQKLCDIVDSGKEIGRVTREFSDLTGVPEGLPLISTGSDKGCETLGLSVYRENQAAISLGTTATVQFTMKKYVAPQKFMPAYPAVQNDRYNPEIQIYRGFWLISWFVREFGAAEKAEAEKSGISPEQLLDSRIRELPPCCDGLLLQPYWTPGVVNPSSRGAVIGFADHHTRYHLYRAIIEGLGFELFDSMRLMEKRAKLSIDEIFVGGGGAKSDVVMQIFSDIFGLPVKRIQTPEASSVGAAMVAFVALGIFGSFDEAIKNMSHTKDVFTPDKKAHEIYSDMYNRAYRKMFPVLEPIYKNIIKITKHTKGEK